MIPILYESTETTFTSNGIHRLIDCISCVVTEERNGIYECDFEYPVNGQYFDSITCGRIIGVKHDDSSDVQPFDIISYTKPIDGIVSFHAVHISYRLKGYVLQDSGIESLGDAMTALASAVPSNIFTYSADFSANGHAGAFNGIPRSVRQLLGGIEGSILDTYGGEYEWDKFDVILHQARGQNLDFAIRYGYNMVDYNDETDYSDTYTSAIPYWIGTDANDQAVTVVGNKVSSGLTPYNGIEKCAALDLSEKFEDEPTTAELEAYALALMTSKHVNLAKQSINVGFVRLQDFSEYWEYEELLQCKLCDSIKVIFPDYQTSAYFKIVRTEYDVLEERFSAMELGTLSTTLAEALGIDSTSSGGGSGGGGGGGTTNYNDLTNKPSINNVTLSGNMTTGDLGIHDLPSGGLAGEVLTKSSGTDYDVTWATVSGSGGNIVYCTCTTNSETQQKSATIQSGTLTSLVTGAQVVVKFSNYNSASAPTLKVGNTDAKTIKRYNGQNVGDTIDTSWHGGSAVYLVYDGTYWQMVGFLNTTYSEIATADITNSTGTTTGLVSGRAAKAAVDAFAPVTDVTAGGTSVMTGTTAAIPVFSGATTSVNGALGLVPQPVAGENDAMLFGDGIWDKVLYSRLLTSTAIYLQIRRDSQVVDTYDFEIPLASSTAAGLMSPTQKSMVDNMYINIYPVGVVFETVDSAYDPNTSIGNYWAMLGQLVDSDGVYLETSDGEALYADEPSIVRTYKWVRTGTPK